MEDGQKRFKEKRAAEEAGDDAQIWMMDIMAPIRNWQAVSESGPTEAVRKSCLVAMVAATLHTYLPAQEITKSGTTADVKLVEESSRTKRKRARHGEGLRVQVRLAW